MPKEGYHKITIKGPTLEKSNQIWPKGQGYQEKTGAKRISKLVSKLTQELIVKITTMTNCVRNNLLREISD